MTEAQWLEVLNTLRESQPILGPVTYEVSDLLEKGVNKATHRIPMAHLSLSVSLSEMLWHVVVASSEEKHRDEADDWLLEAINHPAGSLLTFRLHVLSILREAAGENWAKIPSEHKSFLESVLAGT